MLKDADNIQFDLARVAQGLIGYYGSVNVVDGREVTVKKTCEGDNQDYRTRVEGVVWLAPQDEEFVLEGTSAAGSWRRESVIATEYNWEFPPDPVNQRRLPLL